MRLPGGRAGPRIVLLAILLSMGLPSGRSSADPGADDKPRKWLPVTPRQHDLLETTRYVGALYAISGVAFFILSENEIAANASVKKYFGNLGQITAFDNDSPNANWVVHVFTGAQTFLFYRGRSYSKPDAFLLTLLQSSLFEFTVEIVQEPASLEDLVNTPVVGSTLGVALEYATFPLLNSDSALLRTLGYLLNPTAFLGLNEGELKLMPMLGKTRGLAVRWEF